MRSTPLYTRVVCLTFAILFAWIGVFANIGSAAAYNGAAARQYADQWWNSVNTGAPHYYINATSYGEINDCTNYVSQALYAGGLTEIFTGNGADQDAWWWDSPDYADSWIRAMVPPSTPPSQGSGLVNHAYRYIDWRFKPQLYWTGLKVGDFYSYDSVGPPTSGPATHSRIVTELRNEEGTLIPYANQHTPNRYHVRYDQHWAYGVATVWKIHGCSSNGNCNP